MISNIVADDANIIFGTSVDETYADEIAVTVVATSFDIPEEGNFNAQAAYAPPAYPPQEYGNAPPPGGAFRQPPPPAARKPGFWSRF